MARNSTDNLRSVVTILSNATGESWTVGRTPDGWDLVDPNGKTYHAGRTAAAACHFVNAFVFGYWHAKNA